MTNKITKSILRVNEKKTTTLWFFVALICGGVGLWFIKKVTSNSWLPAIFAAGVIIALTIYYILNDKTIGEEKGDNVYYLGLLFTLISLMFSLLEIFKPHANVAGSVIIAQNIENLLPNFGTALISTIVGIAGRIIVQNLQEYETENLNGPFLPPNATNIDLQDFNRHLLGRIARDLTQGANALARFHRIVRNHASETEDFLHGHRETLIQESVSFQNTLQSDIENYVKDIKNKADTTLNSVGSSFGAVANKTEDILGQLELMHKKHLTNARDTTQSFHNDIKSASFQSLESLKQNFEQTVKQSQNLVQNLSDSHKEVQNLLKSLTVDLRETSATFSNSMEQNLSSSANFFSEMDKLSIAITSLNTTLATVDEISNNTIATIKEFDNFKNSLNAAHKEANLTKESLNNLANAAKKQLDNINQAKVKRKWQLWKRKQ